MSVINTNYLALVSQNNLTKSQSALGTAIERLSSGMRINSAKDDAAGQAIANRFTANIKGLTQASRNANDGISIAQTTEGSLNEINNNLQRIRELSVQAANGSNSQSDLDSIQAEIKERLDEINRVSDETQFNGKYVLGDDADQVMSIQVGAHDSQRIDIQLSRINQSTLGLDGFNVNGKGSVANTAATTQNLLDKDFTAGATNPDGSVTYTGTTANAEATAENVFGKVGTGDTVTYDGVGNGLNKQADGNTYTYDAATQSFSFDADDVAVADLQAYLNANELTTGVVNINGGTTMEVRIDNAGALTTKDGAALYLDSVGNLTQTQAEGGEVAATLTALGSNAEDSTLTIGSTVITFDTTAGSEEINVAGASISAEDMATAAEAAVGGYSVTIGATQYDIDNAGAVAVNGSGDAVFTDGEGNLTIETDSTTTYYAQTNGSITNGFGSLIYADADGNITDKAETETARTTDPLKALDDALQDVDDLRSHLGAIQNRFESTIANLNNTVNNLSAARSRIEDADYAVEVSNMTRAQILQQAGTSVLAQANQIPQTVLSLLR
ncbi:MAG: flagellin FliC [Alcaligenaceae bacterium]|nr:flagellin FliC [Alcaligenaceae bacterium]